MSLRAVLLSLVLLAVLGLGAVGWLMLDTSSAPPPDAIAAEPPEAPPQMILAAARPLRAGALLGPGDLIAKPVAGLAEIPPDLRTDTPAHRAELIGAMIRRPLGEGTLLRAGDDLLSSNGRGFLAAVLGPGMRAISVGVDAVTGTAGLIWPGDHVDLVLTQSMDGANQPAARRLVGETVLTDLRVIAIDRQMLQGATAGDSNPDRAVNTVTLEVTASQAERVAVAQRLGRLTLTVRAAASDQASPAASDAAPLTWGGDVSPALRGGERAPAMLRVFQGAAKPEEYHY